MSRTARTTPPPDLVLHRDTEAPAQLGALTFIGTATVLIELGGFTVLTDPNFLHQGDHAPLGCGLRTTRLTDPAMELEELPAIDFVLLSHHHGDHFDPLVVERLPKHTPIITEPASARKLRRQGFRHVIGLGTWQQLMVRKGERWVRVIATPARHAPGPLRILLPKVMGSVMEFGADSSAPGSTVETTIYVTGDTLFHRRLAEIRDRHPDIDLCVIHLGGTRIAGVMLTMDAADGVRALRLIQPRAAIPVHVDDYDVFTSSLQAFRDAVDASSDLETEVHYLDRGERFVIEGRHS